MKYIKFLFILTFIYFSLFNFKNIYATDELEDLSLSRIYVEPGSLEPEFSETRDYYTLLLNNDVKDLIIQATPTNENLNYEIKGNKNLKEGENLITITVYSKDNLRNKIYTINALETSEPDKYNALLSTLIIDNYPFNEDFFPEKFNYTAKNNVISDNVEVFAYPQNSNASIEIKGSENLKEGENLITITTTSENGLSTRDYNIKINKKSMPKNININQNSINNSNGNSNNNDFKTFIITSTILTFLLLLIIFIFKKK